jgi:hypothetical protein
VILLSFNNGTTVYTQYTIEDAWDWEYDALHSDEDIVVDSPVGASASGGAIQITSLSLPNAQVGSAYSFQLTASGGSGNYAWTLISASPNWAGWLSGGNPIPAGGYSIASGILGSGAVPQQAETETLVVQVEDTVTLATTSATLTLVVNPQ